MTHIIFANNIIFHRKRTSMIPNAKSSLSVMTKTRLNVGNADFFFFGGRGEVHYVEMCKYFEHALIPQINDMKQNVFN